MSRSSRIWGAREALDEVVVRSVASSICADTDAGPDLMCSADMGPADAQSVIRSALRQMHLSAGVDHRARKVSRTIAALEDVDVVRTHHPAEALQYRARVLDL